MKFYYNRLSTNNFLFNLQKENYAQTIAYMIDYKLYDNLKVIPHPFSIEISNDEISVYMILFVGFERAEYQEALTKRNVHFIHWDNTLREMCEFEDIRNEIKIIPIKSICYTSFELQKKNRDLNLFLRFFELDPIAI